ncbi:MAG TPA: 3-oxoacyl-ACP reductase FabG, partial [Victivallales bacterium]|nr:3-oxoacyl-ACP reductase FabG [Victivallales bacterium]
MANIKFNFPNSNVIITGGTRGIGRAISTAFLNAGANVTAIYVANDSAANDFLSQLNSDKLEIVKLNIADYNAVEEFYKIYNSKHDSLDVLVNCAGIRRDSIVGMMSIEDWKKVIEINLTGTFNMTKFALMKMMEKRYGRIINISSPSGKYGFHGQANYSASKAAQEAFSRSLSKEAAKRNITVNCISPGFIETDFISDLTENQKKTYREQIPLKRFGTPEEVANLVLFTASE